MRLDRGQFTLEKNIPVAAGLGGGSADAAAALRLIAYERSTDAENPRIRDAARQCGADVLVCLIPQACIMRGVGDVVSPPVTVPVLPALLVNPRVELPTRDVFAEFSKADCSKRAIGDVPADRDALIAWLKQFGNDLTRAAATLVPTIDEILKVLAALPGCLLARMSGSGPTCVGIFSSVSDADIAAQRLASTYPNWWVCSTTLR
jgi:4-diphosphocytidyl-2-C-methyl-D-erythritol kinase